MIHKGIKGTSKTGRSAAEATESTIGRDQIRLIGVVSLLDKSFCCQEMTAASKSEAAWTREVAKK